MSTTSEAISKYLNEESDLSENSINESYSEDIMDNNDYIPYTDNINLIE